MLILIMSFYIFRLAPQRPSLTQTIHILPPALENHMNQTIISKHCIFWLKNYLPSQHTHIIFL